MKIILAIIIISASIELAAAQSAPNPLDPFVPDLKGYVPMGRSWSPPAAVLEENARRRSAHRHRRRRAEPACIRHFGLGVN